MRHSTIDLTMNVYTDPILLDVHGALDSLPSLDLDASPSTERAAVRATGTNKTDAMPPLRHPVSFVAPVLLHQLLHQTLANRGNLCRLLSSHQAMTMNERRDERRSIIA